MAQETIYIRLAPDAGLILSDSEGHHGEGSITTKVNSGDKVTWECSVDSCIGSIVAIKAKEGSQDIFSDDPVAADSTSIKREGTISENASGKESYYITYTTKGGEQLTDDPVLIVDPH